MRVYSVRARYSYIQPFPLRQSRWLGTIQLMTCSLLSCQAELPSISDSGGQNTSHPSSHDHRLGGTQPELLLPRENLSEQEARWGVLGEVRSRPKSPARLVGGRGGGGGQNFWFVAKHQGIEKECFSAMYIQMNVLKSPLNIL